MKRAQETPEFIDDAGQRIAALFRLLASWDAAASEPQGQNCERRRHPGRQECQGIAGAASPDRGAA